MVWPEGAILKIQASRWSKISLEIRLLIKKKKFFKRPFLSHPGSCGTEVTEAFLKFQYIQYIGRFTQLRTYQKLF